MRALRSWVADEHMDKLKQELDTSSWPIRCRPRRSLSRFSSLSGILFQCFDTDCKLIYPSP
jgi:hypothetical protein